MLDNGCTMQISIHALREEGDVQKQTFNLQSRIISIHALREEGDVIRRCSFPSGFNFYPRPPRGGRPFRFGTPFFNPPNFYPRPPRGGRLCCSIDCVPTDAISIHALREEGDPTLPGSAIGVGLISIHALREEGDAVIWSPS